MQNSIITYLISAFFISLTIILLGILISTITTKILRILPYPLYIFILIYGTFPGVIIHELSHALIALITGAKVVGITLFKTEFDNNGNLILGSVRTIPRGGPILRSIQTCLISIAPTIIGLVLGFFIFRDIFLVTPSLMYKTLSGYLIVCLLLHSDMSSTDIWVFLKGSLIFIIVLAFICFIFKFNYLEFLKEFLVRIKV